MHTIATICARGGSKGVPGKNIRPLFGRPLIEYSIEQALSVPEVNGVYVSTDSPEIARIAEGAGAIVPGLRPAHLAQDDTPKIPVIDHLVSLVEGQIGEVSTVVDLQPTSPLRTPDDISAALALLQPGVDVVITGSLSDANPYYTMVETNDRGGVSLVKSLGHGVGSRQAAPPVFTMNGSIYCWRRSSIPGGLWAGHAVLYEMPRERSVDVDEELDWLYLELVANHTQVLTPWARP